MWSDDDLRPDLIEGEVNKLFKYNQHETDKRNDGNKYFEVDKSRMTAASGEKSNSKSHEAEVGGVGYGFNLNARYAQSSSSGSKFSNELQEHVKNKNQDIFSDTDIKRMLDQSSVQVEWKGQKFVAKSIQVVKIADIVQNTKASLVSKQIEQEEQQGAIIKRVNHDMVVNIKSELNSIEI